jgi:hypothetical protein
MFGLFGNKSKMRPRLLCALYPADTPIGDNLITRSDVGGFTTFLMVLKGDQMRNASREDLAALGLELAAAWSEATVATRAMLGTFKTQELGDGPTILAIASTESLARHAALLFWMEQPGWNGRLGTVVLPVDRFTMMISPCDDAAAVEMGISALAAAHQAMAQEDAQTAGALELLWHDASGFEPILIEDGAIKPGENLQNAVAR